MGRQPNSNAKEMVRFFVWLSSLAALTHLESYSKWYKYCWTTLSQVILDFSLSILPRARDFCKVT